MASRFPVQFGRYELLELLGEGAMAQVYRARLPDGQGSGGQLAIKRLRPVQGRSRGEMEALINEARNGARLRHPNIVRIHELGVMDGTVFVAMEHVRGWTLEDVLTRSLDAATLLPAQAVIAIGRQLLAGLAYAHSALGPDERPMGLVHRDLKPENVFLDRSGQLKILDFGIAQSKLNLHLGSVVGPIQGSPLFMSPEQIEGAPLDGRSDLFSLGSMLVELATGRAPFLAHDVESTLRRVQTGTWDHAKIELRELAPKLLPVAERLLAVDPEQRFTDAEEASIALGQAAEGEDPLLHAQALVAAITGRPILGLPSEGARAYEELAAALRAGHLLLIDPGRATGGALPAASQEWAARATGFERKPTLALPRDALRVLDDLPEDEAERDLVLETLALHSQPQRRATSQTAIVPPGPLLSAPASAPPPPPRIAPTPTPGPIPLAPPVAVPAPAPSPRDRPSTEQRSILLQPAVIAAVLIILVAIGGLLFFVLSGGEEPASEGISWSSAPSPLVHEVPALAKADQPLRIHATISEPGLWQLRATYRAAGGSSRPWKVVTMEPHAGGQYVAWIPVTSTMRAGIDYFIELRDDTGQRWTEGSPDAPLHVPLR